MSSQMTALAVCDVHDMPADPIGGCAGCPRPEVDAGIREEAAEE